MKRIIYSVYTSIIQEHVSSSDYKKSQFEKYKKHLEKSQKDYALLCNADYDLEITTETNYDNIQFDKIKKLEYFSQYYDEVLYLDFDVVPITKINMFDHFNFNSICSFSIDRTPEPQVMRWALEGNGFDGMNMYIKTCAKNAMLLLDEVVGSSTLINTGVIGGNKQSIEKLDFNNRFDEIISVLEQAKTDTLYPEEISKLWKPNNEVFVSYLVERFDIAFTNIGLPWNFLLDAYHPKPSPAAHMLHHVNKQFELSFNVHMD